MGKVLDLSEKHLWKGEVESIITKNLTHDTEIINLATNHVTENSIDIIINHLTVSDSKITVLNLTNSRLTIADSKKLCGSISHSKLEHLILDRNYLNEEVLKILSENIKTSKLKSLSLVGCDLSAESASYLSKSLDGNTNLEILDLRYNQIFDEGVKSLASVISKSSLHTLLLGHCHIWKDGTRILIEQLSLAAEKRLQFLDLGGNIVDLIQLTNQINSTQLKGLCLSDCKIDEKQLRIFLEDLSHSCLETLIMESLDYKPLPIIWGSGREIIWNRPDFFSYLLRSISLPECTLNDLRLGYLTLQQINNISEALTKRNKNLTLTLTNFGNSGQTWVITIPNMEIHCPSNNFIINTKISIEDSNCFPSLFSVTKPPDGPITAIQLSECSINDEIAKRIFEGLMKISEICQQVQIIDLSNNEFEVEGLQFITQFLQSIPPLKKLSIGGNNFSNSEMKALFDFFSQNPIVSPSEIEISFNDPSSTQNLNSEHSAFKSIGICLQNCPNIKKATIRGPISGKDGSAIAEVLGQAEGIEELRLEGPIPEAYKKQQSIDPRSQASFKNAIQAFSNALTNKESKSKLHLLSFPVLTECFLYSDEAQTLWGNVKLALEKRSHF